MKFSLLGVDNIIDLAFSTELEEVSSEAISDEILFILKFRTTAELFKSRFNKDVKIGQIYRSYITDIYESENSKRPIYLAATSEQSNPKDVNDKPLYGISIFINE